MNCRASLLVLVVFAISASAFAPAPIYRDRPKAETKKPLAEQMIGRWESVDDKNIVVVTKDTWTGAHLGDSLTYRIKLDTNKTPASLSLDAKDGAISWVGVVKVEGDNLLFCYYLGDAKNLPECFDPNDPRVKGRKAIVWTYRRVK